MALHSKDDLNILFLGQTGVGKTTFINAFANYISYNTLESATRESMIILIPAFFEVSVPTPDGNAYNMFTVKVGEPDRNENHKTKGESSTQGCKAYVFQIGDRKLRLIDAPGIGDTRGVAQDAKNFEHILAFISRYGHLNGICILLKPNEEKLHVLLRFCIKELLTHLHSSAQDNIMFVFTNIRSSLYKLGRTHPLLRQLFDELRVSVGVNVRLSHNNMFLFDNEGFCYLATHQRKEFGYTDDDKRDFIRSWEVSVKEVTRLVAQIISCPAHKVNDTISLNQAKQLIRILSRPIAEVVTLNQENLNLAEEHRIKLLSGEQSSMLQKSAEIVVLPFPRTVCTSADCKRVILVDGERKIEYFQHCHPHCHLSGVEQEVIGHTTLQQCDAINKSTGLCYECGCMWNKHMHITYEYRKFVVLHNTQTSSTAYQSLFDPANQSTSSSSVSPAITTDAASSLQTTDKHIADLQKERESIVWVCAKLSQFLQANSITPFNDDIFNYMKLFIEEEEKKKAEGAQNDDIIRGLNETVIDYTRQIYMYKQAVTGIIPKAHDVPTIQEIFDFVETLYSLPINGQHICKQVETLRRGQRSQATTREHVVELPAIAKTSTVMLELNKTINSAR